MKMEPSKSRTIRTMPQALEKRACRLGSSVDMGRGQERVNAYPTLWTAKMGEGFQRFKDRRISGKDNYLRVAKASAARRRARASAARTSSRLRGGVAGRAS